MKRCAAAIAVVVMLVVIPGRGDALRLRDGGGGSQPAAAQPRRARLHESALRKMAKVKPVPVYPAAALAKGLRGVVVAELETNTQGQVVAVNILESAAPEFGDAVRATLRKWSWPPPAVKDNAGPVFIMGRLTFYFDIVDGKGVVNEPAETQKPATTKPGVKKPPL